VKLESKMTYYNIISHPQEQEFSVYKTWYICYLVTINLMKKKIYITTNKKVTEPHYFLK
jgi:hypothetical protein